VAGSAHSTRGATLALWATPTPVRDTPVKSRTSTATIAQRMVKGTVEGTVKGTVMLLLIGHERNAAASFRRV